MLKIDVENGQVEVATAEGVVSYPIGSPEAFKLISQAWLRSGWDAKYVYGFSWMGRPIIQLPEDMMRIQEVLYQIKPDVVIETGIAHGGSLIFYASLFKAMNKGRVIGIDIEIRPHNRQAIEAHEMSDKIAMIEGSSIDENVVGQVKKLVSPNEKAVVILDSNHSRSHVLAELRAYSGFVSIGSYIVACDGIMQEVVGAPRTSPEWNVDNPQSAVKDFLAECDNFILAEPVFPFNEGQITERVTYWPNAFLKRIK
jgi:cephalosporin hydroxylase